MGYCSNALHNVNVCLIVGSRTRYFLFRELTTLAKLIGFELVLFASWGVIPTFGKKVGLGNEFYLMLALNM